MSAVADSGCQACLMGPGHLHKMGLKKSDQCRIRTQSTSINGGNLNVLGAIVLRIAGIDPKDGQESGNDGVKDFFISKGVMKALGIIEESFPSITSVGTSETQTLTGGARSNAGCQMASGVGNGPKDASDMEKCPCGCKPRRLPPP